MLNPDIPPEYFATDEIISQRSLNIFQRLAVGEGSLAGNGGIIIGEKRISFSLAVDVAELSGNNKLVLELENSSRGSVLVGLQLKHSKSFYQSSLSGTSFSGGRECLNEFERKKLFFPLESFGFYGYPLDWAYIRQIEVMVFRDRDQIALSPVEIKVFGLWAQRSGRPRGPRLKFNALPQILSSHSNSILNKEIFTSLARLSSENHCSKLNYIPFSILDPRIFIPPPHAYSFDQAEDVLNGIIMGQAITGKIDWSYTPNEAHEWTHFLNRHHFLRPVVIKFATENCDRCFKYLEEILQDWIVSNPVPLDSNGGAGPSWETLTVAWRLREWFWIAGLLSEDNHFSNYTVQLILCSVWEHARSLMNHKGHPNNWIVVESSALAVAGLLFDCFKEAEIWFNTGIERLNEQLDRQFFRDGSHFEISPLYHSICLNAISEVVSVSRFLERDIPKQFEQLIPGMIRFLKALKRPDGSWPSINDSGTSTMDYSATISGVEQSIGQIEKYNRNQFGPNETHQEMHLDCYSDSGIVILRSGNSQTDNFLVFRAGPAGAAHVHGDSLSIEACFNGHLGLVDPGITDYSPGPLTDYYRASRSHNVVLVDDEEPFRASLSYHDRIASARNSITVDQDCRLIVAFGCNPASTLKQNPNLHLSRTVIFVNTQFWIIRDHIHGHGLHKVSTFWKCFPSEVNLSSESLSCRIRNTEGLNFQISPFPNDIDMRCQIIQGSMIPWTGWASIQGKDYPAPSIEYTIDCELPKTLFWGLFPEDFTGQFPERLELNQVADISDNLKIRFSKQRQIKLTLQNLDELSRQTKNFKLLDAIHLEE